MEKTLTKTVLNCQEMSKDPYTITYFEPGWDEKENVTPPDGEAVAQIRRNYRPKKQAAPKIRFLLAQE